MCHRGPAPAATPPDRPWGYPAGAVDPADFVLDVTVADRLRALADTAAANDSGGALSVADQLGVAADRVESPTPPTRVSLAAALRILAGRDPEVGPALLDLAAELTAER